MDKYLGTDLGFAGELLVAPDGDVDLVAGRACLLQDLRHRLMTPKGALWCHPEYGVDLYDFLHLEGTEVNRLDFLMRLEEAVEADPRIEPGSVQASILRWDWESIVARVTCLPRGSANPLSLVVGYGISAITAEILQG